eukprot:TRINITY_DN33317_c0_g1_i1.p1 TRINITY_DN33317_c0_g1~~TRINITY_DN33317_c0_g1_i1.p1  ORF type:complete len:716 (+),score=45.20 TRINITY_DN33317_c0_g1_i1:156-2303(+)
MPRTAAACVLGTSLLMALIDQVVSNKLIRRSATKTQQCVKLSKRYKVNIAARCGHEYMGTPQITRCGDCDHSSDSPFAMRGCVPQVCRSTVADGYEVSEIDLRRPFFSVKATCKAGWTGIASVVACGDHDTPYTLSGCSEAAECQPPTSDDTIGYAHIVERSKRQHSFDVDVSCDSDHLYYANTGLARATACNTPGGRYSLEGCVPELCVRPSNSLNYTLHEHNLARGYFDVEATCADSYDGNAQVVPCTVKDGPYSVSGCTAEVCTQPTDTLGYNFTVNDLSRPTFDVTVTCAEGFHPCPAYLAPWAESCAAEGDEFKLKGCCATLCSHPSWVGYEVIYTDADLMQSQFRVQASCAHGWTGDAKATVCENCVAGSPCNYSLTGCAEESCTTPAVAGYIVLKEDSLERDTFKVTVGCNSSTHARSEIVEATVCTGHGLPYHLSGCTPKVCSTPSDTTGYNITENSLRIFDFDVLVSCAPGYMSAVSSAILGPHASACKHHDEVYEFGGCIPVYYTAAVCVNEETDEEIDYAQECFIASQRLKLPEKMSTGGILENCAHKDGCFKDEDGLVSFNKCYSRSSATPPVPFPGSQAVCSRRTSPVSVNYVLQEYKDVVSQDGSVGGGVGFCTNHPYDSSCCAAWEKIHDFETCKRAGDTLQLNTSNMIGPECIQNLQPGCFYAPVPGSAYSGVRFEKRECGSTAREDYTVHHICAKIQA